MKMLPAARAMRALSLLPPTSTMGLAGGVEMGEGLRSRRLTFGYEVSGLGRKG